MGQKLDKVWREVDLDSMQDCLGKFQAVRRND